MFLDPQERGCCSASLSQASSFSSKSHSAWYYCAWWRGIRLSTPSTAAASLSPQLGNQPPKFPIGLDVVCFSFFLTNAFHNFGIDNIQFMDIERQLYMYAHKHAVHQIYTSLESSPQPHHTFPSTLYLTTPDANSLQVWGHRFRDVLWSVARHDLAHFWHISCGMGHRSGPRGTIGEETNRDGSGTNECKNVIVRALDLCLSQGNRDWDQSCRYYRSRMSIVVLPIFIPS